MYYCCFLNVVFIRIMETILMEKVFRTLTDLELCACICITFIKKEEEASLPILEEAMTVYIYHANDLV